ncbi:hypothetical protein pb186bvf_010933 [Paramecium bursaria]
MQLVLQADQLIEQMTSFSGKRQNDPINKNEAYKILNTMSMANKYPEFSYDFAVEIFDRIEQKQTDLCISEIAMAFVEANQTLQMKFNLTLEQEQLTKESLHYVQNLKQNSQETKIQIEHIQYYGTQHFKPYLLIFVGSMMYETNVGDFENGWYRWSIDKLLDIQSLVPDLKIQIMEEREQCGQVLLAMEILPQDDLKEAQFPVYENNINTECYIVLSCQLFLGSNANMLKQEKQNYLIEKLNQYQEDFYVYEEQLLNLCRPFISNSESMNYRKSINEQFQQPIQNELTLKRPTHPNQYDIFSNNQKDIASLELRPSVGAAAFRNVVNLKQEPKKESAIKKYPLARLDVFLTISMIITMFINYENPNFTPICSLLILIMAVMLKKQILIKVLLGYIILDLIYDIGFFICYQHTLLTLLMRISNFLVKLFCLYSCYLLQQEQHLTYLKQQFLIISY